MKTMIRGMNIVKFLFVGLLFWGCSTKDPAKKAEYEECMYKYDLMFRFAAEMKQKYGLQLTGYGGSPYFNNVHFKIAQYYNEDDARALILSCADDFLKVMNADPRLKTILTKKPHPREHRPSWASDIDFDYSNVHMIIGFSYDFSERPAPHLHFVAMNEGRILFNHWDEKHEHGVFYAREPISLALEKARSQRSDEHETSSIAPTESPIR